jgi:CarD family transcriptional regulator
VKLSVGDPVVYPAHGTGRVSARLRRSVLGVEQDVVVIEFTNGLSVTLPLRQARERLRPVLSKADVSAVQRTLRQAGEITGGSWRQRLKEGHAKLASGDPLELAEVIRDSAMRERVPNFSRSEQERRLYAKARHHLAEEIGSACNLHQDEADAWIEEQLRLTDSGE